LWRTPASTADAWAETKYAYDIAGNVTRIEHPSVNVATPIIPVTTGDYTDAYRGRSQRRRHSPITWGGSSRSQTQTATRPYTGTVEGRRPTLDELCRLTKVTLPIGQTSFVYNATANSVTTNRQLNSGTTLSAHVYVDGLGRVKQTVDANPAKVDTTYDPLGRVDQVSNPYIEAPTGLDDDAV
jgi:YD repeat-containing protein